MPVRKDRAGEKKLPGGRGRGGTPASASPEELLDALKAVRSRLARRENVPAYIVFSNAALTDMASKAPRTLEELLEVSGVGQVKAAKYGEAFLTAISGWREKRYP